MADRQEFRFVVDGLELDERGRSHVASAVQRAGLEALASLELSLDNPVLLGHTSLRLDPGWYGMWVINGRLAEELGGRIDEIGFFRRER